MPGSETFSPFLNADIRIPFFSGDVLKKFALIALHSIAEKGRGGENGCHAPDLGDEWKLSCPKSPLWESEGEAWSEDESVSSTASHKGNMCNDALHVEMREAWKLGDATETNPVSMHRSSSKTPNSSPELSDPVATLKNRSGVCAVRCRE